jgi:hypothetical protein
LATKEKFLNQSEDQNLITNQWSLNHPPNLNEGERAAGEGKRRHGQGDD